MYAPRMNHWDIRLGTLHFLLKYTATTTYRNTDRLALRRSVIYSRYEMKEVLCMNFSFGMSKVIKEKLKCVLTLE